MLTHCKVGAIVFFVSDLARSVDFYRGTLGLPIDALDGHDGPWAMGEVGELTLVFIPPIARVAESVATQMRAQDFVEAARLRGEGLWWLVTREVLPNAAAPLIAEFGLRFCFVFLFISALSFLGLGIQPPTADWGSMVRDNAVLITFGDISPLLPALAVALITVSVNFVVDWMLHKSSGLKEC